jgi:hypothetical protein
MSRRILITSAGSGPCNNLMRSLLHGDPSTFLIGCHSDRFILKHSRGQRNFLLPPSDSAFDQALRSVITDARADMVIPGNDQDALALAKLHEQAPLPCRSFLPAFETIELCQDKYVLNLRLRDRGVPVARTFAVSGRASLNEAWEALDRRDLT